MRKVELLPTWDCEAGYGPAGKVSNFPRWGISAKIAEMGNNVENDILDPKKINK